MQKMLQKSVKLDFPLECENFSKEKVGIGKSSSARAQVGGLKLCVGEMDTSPFPIKMFPLKPLLHYIFHVPYILIYTMS